MQVKKTRRHYEPLIRERILKHNRILKELIVRDVANIFSRSSKTWSFNEKVGRNKMAKKNEENYLHSGLRYFYCWLTKKVREPELTEIKSPFNSTNSFQD